MTQAALILVNADTTGQTYATPGDAVLRCDVCGERFQALRQLHDHLHSVHRLEPLDWDPLRDMVDNNPVCSHCMSLFADKPAVRQHITLGQCPSFDPLRIPSENPVSAEWQALLAAGHIAQLREAPMKRLALTLHCQFCATRFQRTGDLSLHLQTVHSKLWQESQMYVQLLVDTSGFFGCLCNPVTNASGLQHICVAVRQLGMMASKMSLPLFLPWTFEQSQLQHFLQAVLEHPAVPHMIEHISQRDFSFLWTDPMMIQLLRSRCLLCGLTLHPAELRDHLRMAHPSDIHGHELLLPQLIQAFSREHNVEHQCDVCSLIFNYPAHGNEDPEERNTRQLLAQIHLQHQCPALLQVALLLSDHERRQSLLSRRLRDAGDVQADGTTAELGSLRQTRRRQRQQEGQEESQERRCQRRRRQDLAGHGAVAPQSGCRAAGSEASRLLDLLHANRVSSAPAVLGAEGSRVEETAAGENGANTGAHPSPTEMPPHSTHGGDSDVQAAETEQQCAGRSIEADGFELWPSESSRCFSFSTMEPAHPEPPADEPGPHHLSEDAEVRRATSRDPERSQRDCEISQSQTDVNRASGALAMASVDAIGRSPSSSEHAAREYGLEPLRPHHPSSPTPSQQTGPTSADAARQGQEQGLRQIEEQGQTLAPSAGPSRQTLLHSLAGIRVANDSNWCYVNAAVLTMVWSYLSLSTFQLEYWGPHATQIADMLLCHDNEPIELAHVSCFQFIFQQWQGLGNQGDPVEFLAHMMKGLRLSGINMSWEKRVQVGLITEVVDESDQYTPLILRFDPAMLQDGTITLSQMLRDWANQDGMMTALLHPTPLVCVQLDRLIRSGDGQISKCDIPVNFHWGLDLPFFDSEGLTITWKTYRVIAAIAHLGHDTAGHCRTMLKVEMNATASTPYMFLLTEDWMRATPVWKEPPWFIRNITCFWLGEWDQVALHELDMTQFMSTQRPPEAPTLVGASDLLSHFIDGTEEQIDT